MGTPEEGEASHMLGSRGHTMQVYPGCQCNSKGSSVLSYSPQGILLPSGVRAKYGHRCVQRGVQSPMPEAWARGIHWQSPEVSLPEISLYVCVWICVCTANGPVLLIVLRVITQRWSLKWTQYFALHRSFV